MRTIPLRWRELQTACKLIDDAARSKPMATSTALRDRLANLFATASDDVLADAAAVLEQRRRRILRIDAALYGMNGLAPCTRLENIRLNITGPVPPWHDSRRVTAAINIIATVQMRRRRVAIAEAASSKLEYHR